VHDENLHSDAVGKIHEILLDNVVAAGVGSSAVAEDDKHPGIGIEGFEVATPNARYKRWGLR